MDILVDSDLFLCKWYQLICRDVDHHVQIVFVELVRTKLLMVLDNGIGEGKNFLGHH